ncbi:CHASE2 domain-containing protein [Thermaurantiacus sp.]
MFGRLQGGLFGSWLLLLAVAMSLVGVATLAAPLARLDNLIYDAILRFRPPAPSSDILIVAIDNRSVRELGRWPWPREVHARLIDRLVEARPIAIGYDILFVEPEPGPRGDAALSAAIRNSEGLVLPYLIEIPGEDGLASRVVLPTPVGADHGLLGHAVVRPDPDGVVRGIEPLVTGASRTALPHLADLVLEIARGGAIPEARPPASGALVLATSGDRIRFRRGPEGYAQVSFSDVLAGRIPREFLTSRIVLVGATASGLGDRFATPMSGRFETMAGVEVIANHIDAALRGDRIRVAPLPLQFVFSALPVLLLMLGLLKFGPRVNLWLGLLWSLLTLLASALILRSAGLWLPPATAMVGIALIYPLWGWRRLDFTNRFMAAELEAMVAEPAVLPSAEIELPPAGDAVARQVGLMHAAIRNVRDLKRFVAESLDSLPDAALVTNLDGKVLIANDAADALFAGRLDRPLAGATLGDALAALHQGDAALEAEAAGLLDIIRAGVLPPSQSSEWRLADGTALDVRLAFFSDDERNPLGWILRFVDITSLRAAERQREEALRLLTHDMRSPQASILAILEAEGEAVPQAVRARIARHASQTLALADQYVQFARAEFARPAFELFDLNEAALDAADDLWPLARARGVSVETRMPDGEALVRGDRSLITRAIQNLVGNAIKYGAERAPVVVSVVSQGSTAELRVTDRGPGIPADQLPGLFEPFRRLDAPEGRAPEPGAGLGLAFVKRVIERHGGAVFAQSMRGEGSTFGFTLPLAVEARASAAGNSPQPGQAAVAIPAPAASARAAS